MAMGIERSRFTAPLAEALGIKRGVLYQRLTTAGLQSPFLDVEAALKAVETDPKLLMKAKKFRLRMESDSLFRELIMGPQKAAKKQPAPAPVAVVTVTNGASGHVAWIAGESLLPTLQFALILDMGAAAGVHLGDRVTIYAENGSFVATADVVRVDPHSATALVTRQSAGTLAAGLAARVTEKLP